jgi:enoyl-CoA hydratase
MTENPVVIIQVEDKIMFITINRPKKLNALNDEVLEEIGKAIDALNSDDAIRGAIITGQGEKAFVAGADIGAFLEAPKESGKNLAKKGQDVFFKIEQSKKPIIAAVNGYALGGGCELALSCHFRIASANAKFGQPEINLGIIPGYGGTQRLPLLIGKGRAMEMMMTAENIDAAEAFRIGLVNCVCSEEALMDIAKQKMLVIIQKPTFALEQLIKAVNGGMNNLNGYVIEANCFGESFASEEKTEGVTAFLEKRKPIFNQ